MEELLQTVDTLNNSCSVLESPEPSKFHLTASLLHFISLTNRLNQAKDAELAFLELDEKRLQRLRSICQKCSRSSKDYLTVIISETMTEDSFEEPRNKFFPFPHRESREKLCNILKERGYLPEMDDSDILLPALRQEVKVLKTTHEEISAQLAVFYGLPPTVPEAKIFVQRCRDSAHL